ncbi:MAG TPA: ABC transporter ATP-binding protein [Roseiflexaceae bacterium]|nr:ABC transporter ATP-binding protein [Roseiflexaceae bacterium]
MDETDFLVVDGITKAFNGFVANDGISLRVGRGQVHALLGENGAGKSTLMKILYGVYRPDSGTLMIDGKPARIESPADAREAGIGMVFQSFMLIPAFSVIENVALSLNDLGIMLDNQAIEARIKEISDRYDFGIDPQAKVWQLPLGAQQKVEIIKLVLAGAKLLIFDEPTSVLAPHEAEGLFKIFDSLRQSGYTIIFISHKLNEVLACCDAITVLRQGRVVGSLPRAEATEQKLVSLIVGNKAFDSRAYARKPTQQALPAVELRGVEAFDDRGRQALHGVDLVIHPGEIVGVAGVSGNGQKELGEVIQGVRPISGGTLLIDGVEASQHSVAQRRAAGVACIPEDPLLMGAVRIMTVEENLALGDTGEASSRGWRPMNWPAARSKAAWLTDRFQLKMPRLHVLIEKLSGGNVQRIVCAREMSMRPKVLLAYYPTRGMDINAAEIIRTALLSARDDGAAILVVSEDLDELVGISDRIVVMFHGQNVGESTPEQADIHEIGFLMTDGTRKAA